MSVIYGPDAGTGWDAEHEVAILLSTVPYHWRNNGNPGLEPSLAGIIGRTKTTWEHKSSLRRGGSITLLKVRTLPAETYVSVLITIENDYTPYRSQNIEDWSISVLELRLDVFNRHIALHSIPDNVAGYERVYRFLERLALQYAGCLNGGKLVRGDEFMFRMPLSRLFPGSPWARLRGLEELPPGGGRLAAESRKNQLALDLLDEERNNDLDDAQEFADSQPGIPGPYRPSNTLPTPPWAEDRRETSAYLTRNRAAGPTLLGRRW